MKSIIQPGDVLTEKQAAELLSLAPDTLRAWRTRKAVKANGPPYLQRGRWKGVRYLRADLISWLESQRKTDKENPQ